MLTEEATGSRPARSTGLVALAWAVVLLLAALPASPAGAAPSAAPRVVPLPHNALPRDGSPFKLARGNAHGVVMRRDVARHGRAFGLAAPLSEPCTTVCSGPLLYHEGGAVMHRVKIYLIQWEPPEPTNNGQENTTFEQLPSGYLAELETYISDVAAASGTLGNAFSVDTLYGEAPAPGQPPSAGEYSVEFGGAFKDPEKYPVRDLSTCPLPTAEEPFLPPEGQPCISDAEGPSEENNFQLSEAVLKFIAAHPSLATGLEAIYVMLTPHDVNSCAGFEGTVAACNTNFYCAYHSAFGFTHLGEHIAVYANMPYDDVPGCEVPDQPHGSPADSDIDTLSHEVNEAITDPLGDAWFDIGGNEVADKCTYPFFDPLIDFNPSADAYGPLLGGVPAEFEEAGEQLVLRKPGTAYNQTIANDHFFTQREWSNAAGGCVAQAPQPTASFSVYASPAVVGATVSFNGAASSPAAGTLTDYRWDFGDGESVDGAESRQVTHTYARPGQYTAKLTITNDSGASAETSRTVVVEEPQPAPPEHTTTVTVPGPTTTVTTPGPTVTVTVPAPPVKISKTPSSTKHKKCPSSSHRASKGCPATRRPAATRTPRHRCGSPATSRHGRRCQQSKKRSSARSPR